MKTYKNFVIDDVEGTQKGIFFRNPIQKVFYDADYHMVGVPDRISAWYFYNKSKATSKNFFFKLYHILIGNKRFLKDVPEWADSDDDGTWAGFTANIFVSPIYFQREYRRLKATAQDKTENIQSVESYGYEGPYNHCSGACHIERTVIRTKRGERIRKCHTKSYHWTYFHKIKELVDGLPV